jgi:hypothetical protein
MNGMMEWWSDGMMGRPTFQHSSIPTLPPARGSGSAALLKKLTTSLHRPSQLDQNSAQPIDFFVDSVLSFLQSSKKPG